MKCENCNAENREGELICHACGALLTVAAATRRLNITTGMIGFNQGRAPTDTLQSIAFEIDGLLYDFPVTDGDEILIGRGNSGLMSHASALDLMNVAGGEKGVSRKHALVRIEGKHAFLIDLSSTNGTFLNGRRLAPSHKHLLYGGDMVCFGGLEARVKLG
jgi:hypothetical protein